MFAIKSQWFIMHVRFFNTYEPVTTFYRDLLPFLAEAGLSVDVLISSAEYRANRTVLSQEIDQPGVRIFYLPTGGILPTGRLQKVWLMLAYMVSAAFTSLSSKSVDMNFFLTQPPLFALWGWVLKVIRRQPYICLLMDVYPDVAIRDGVLAKRSVLTRALSTLARFAWQHANSVIVIGRCMQEYLVRSGIPAERIRVIPNWINEEIVYPVEPACNTLRHRLGLNDVFLIVYSGNMGISHEFGSLLTAAELLRTEKRIQFILIGDGCRRASIQQYQKEKKLDNLIFLPFQPIDKLNESLSLGDLMLVTLRDGLEGLVVPSKAYSALGAARPLVYVGNPSGEIARMIVEEKIGSVVPPQAGYELAQTILRYYRQPDLCKEHGQNAFALSRGRYSRQQALVSYLNVLCEN
jgi:glycosyltransferase involved in cell wall biosynthesis